MDKNQRIMFAIAVSCTIAGGLVASVLSPPVDEEDALATAPVAPPEPAASPAPAPVPMITDLPEAKTPSQVVRPIIPVAKPVRPTPPLPQMAPDRTLDDKTRRAPSRLLAPDEASEIAPERPKISVEITVDDEPETFPVVPKPAYVRFILAPDQVETNGFLGDSNRIELADSDGEERPDRYRIHDLKTEAHRVLDFPGFCSVVAHAKSAEDEIVWLPLHDVPLPAALEPFSRVAADPAAIRLLERGEISLDAPEGWWAQAWLVCSDETVDGMQPFATPRALTWMSGLALGDGTLLTGERTDG